MTVKQGLLHTFGKSNLMFLKTSTEKRYYIYRRDISHASRHHLKIEDLP